MIVPHYDLSGLLARYDVRDDSVSSHPRKQILSMTRAMSEEDRTIVQAYVNESFQRFKDIVKAGRPRLRQANAADALMDQAGERDLATGEIFTAAKAREYGLIDEIGFIEDAIDRAIELAGLNARNVRVVQYQRPMSLVNLMGLAEASDADFPLDALWEISTPRAYYLATSWPPLVTSRREIDELAGWLPALTRVTRRFRPARAAAVRCAEVDPRDRPVRGAADREIPTEAGIPDLPEVAGPRNQVLPPDPAFDRHRRDPKGILDSDPRRSGVGCTRTAAPGTCGRGADSRAGIAPGH